MPNAVVNDLASPLVSELATETELVRVLMRAFRCVVLVAEPREPVNDFVSPLSCVAARLIVLVRTLKSDDFSAKLEDGERELVVTLK